MPAKRRPKNGIQRPIDLIVLSTTRIPIMHYKETSEMCMFCNTVFYGTRHTKIYKNKQTNYEQQNWRWKNKQRRLLYNSAVYAILAFCFLFAIWTVVFKFIFAGLIFFPRCILVNCAMPGLLFLFLFFYV